MGKGRCKKGTHKKKSSKLEPEVSSHNLQAAEIEVSSNVLTLI